MSRKMWRSRCDDARVEGLFLIAGPMVWEGVQHPHSPCIVYALHCTL